MDITLEALPAYNTIKNFHPKKDNKLGFMIGKTIASLKACLLPSNPAISVHFTSGDSVKIVPEMESIISCSSAEY